MDSRFPQLCREIHGGPRATSSKESLSSKPQKFPLEPGAGHWGPEPQALLRKSHHTAPCALREPRPGGLLSPPLPHCVTARKLSLSKSRAGG